MQAEEDIIILRWMNGITTYKDHAAIRDAFDAERDAKFPGWREKYEAEFAEWIAAMK